MNKFVIRLIAAGAMCAGVCQSASSADVAVRPAAPLLAPIWTGFYVGGNVGSAWAHDETTISTTIPVGGGIGVSAPLTSQSETGFIGGVQGGYNYQWGMFVLGIEADAD